MTLLITVFSLSLPALPVAHAWHGKTCNIPRLELGPSRLSPEKKQGEKMSLFALFSYCFILSWFITGGSRRGWTSLQPPRYRPERGCQSSPPRCPCWVLWVGKCKPLPLPTHLIKLIKPSPSPSASLPIKAVVRGCLSPSCGVLLKPYSIPACPMEPTQGCCGMLSSVRGRQVTSPPPPGPDQH